jgi:hypothetical protein
MRSVVIKLNIEVFPRNTVYLSNTFQRYTARKPGSVQAPVSPRRPGAHAERFGFCPNGEGKPLKNDTLRCDLTHALLYNLLVYSPHTCTPKP